MSDDTHRERAREKSQEGDELKYAIRRDGEFIIHLTYDVPFKFVFAQPNASEELLANFINEILELSGDQRIAELTYLNVEVPPSALAGRRLGLDLRVTDQRGVTYNVELQRENTASILKRALFQQSRITGEQLSVRQSFNKLTPVVVILLCDYSIYPDRDPVRVFRLTPYKPRDVKGLNPLPHRLEHFDPESAPRYHQLKRRVEVAEEALDLIRFHLVELTKPLEGLTLEQEAWLKYLTTEFIFPDGDDDMNQREPKRPQYLIPAGVSEETRLNIERAQARLDLFAGRPEHRSAYEEELILMMDHNTQIESSFEEGREEGREEGIAIGEARRLQAMALVVKSMRRLGVDDDEIASSLNLTAEERAALLGSR